MHGVRSGYGNGRGARVLVMYSSVQRDVIMYRKEDLCKVVLVSIFTAHLLWKKIRLSVNVACQQQ